ncbi:MAG: hypothetical protein KAU95_01960, partial [Candidatus Aenigmarchaeota archaeon]|nr:hypothetical protein [Candidatus Aenigmarchaeota archaeon]
MTTDENAVCKYNTSDEDFSNMTNFTTTETTTHSIEISYTSDDSGTYYVRCNDTAGNEMTNSSSINYTADVTVTEDETSPGGGTSGTGRYPIYKPTQEQLKDGYEKSLGKNWILEFKVNNEDHQLKVDNIDNSNKIVTITVSSNPQTFNLRLDEIKKLDLNNDGHYDFYIEMENIIYNRANLIIKTIYEEIPTGQLPDKMQCNWLYWFDEDSTECGYKEFCGTLIYLGLRTFETLEECESSLEIAMGETEKICDEGIKRCSGNKLWECRNNKWTTIETCDYGCSPTSLTCNPPIEKPEKKDFWLHILIGVMVLVVIAVLIETGKVKKKLKAEKSKPKKKN